MSNEDNDRKAYDEADELGAVLSHWKAPDTPHRVDDRVLAAYRKRMTARPFWERMLTRNVSMPMPLAASVALLVLGPALWSITHPRTVYVESQPAPVVEERIKYVEVPVVEEKIITRTVFVEKGTKRGPSRQSDTPPSPAGPVLALQGATDENGYFTRVNLAGFQPAEEMKARIIKGEKSNEK